jgi:hypothetical protein
MFYYSITVFELYKFKPNLEIHKWVINVLYIIIIILFV